jgi:hypothetical protein
MGELSGRFDEEDGWDPCGWHAIFNGMVCDCVAFHDHIRGIVCYGTRECSLATRGALWVGRWVTPFLHVSHTPTYRHKFAA